MSRTNPNQPDAINELTSVPESLRIEIVDECLDIPGTIPTDDHSADRTTAKLQNRKTTYRSPALPLWLSPALVKFVLLVSLFFTILYAHSYTGEYQVLINFYVIDTFYVIFLGLFISLFFPRMHPLKATVFPAILVCICELSKLSFSPDFIGYSAGNLFFSLFGRTFSPVIFLYIGLGAAITWLILWILHSEKREPHTEVY